MIKEFQASGTFGAITAARDWLSERGFSVGRMCCDEPMGIMKGDFDIQKWRNLSERERGSLHGRITSDDFREGGVTVEIDDARAPTE